MSYSLDIVDPVTRETIQVKEPHNICGGTYAENDTSLWLSITYNYSAFFRRPEVLGTLEDFPEHIKVDEDWTHYHTGLYKLNNKTVEEALILCSKAYAALRDVNLDKDGKEYDMEAVYTDSTLHEIEELKQKIAETSDIETVHTLLTKLNFLENYCTRPRGYWAPTEANAKRSIAHIIKLLILAPANAIVIIS